jgi:hypothetical protein
LHNSICFRDWGFLPDILLYIALLECISNGTQSTVST